VDLMKQEMMYGSGISWTMFKLYLVPDRSPQYLTTQFLQPICTACRPTNRDKALKATSTEGDCRSLNSINYSLDEIVNK